MSEISGEVLNIVQNIFGSSSKSHNHARCQISYDCPVCDEGRHKGNLEINYSDLVMKCWKCSEEPDGLKGSLRKLIKLYGKSRDLKLFDSVVEDYAPEYYKSRFIENYKPNINLPDEYIHMATATREWRFKRAYSYLIGRGLTEEDIVKYDIGYCVEGDYSGRIIIPSYDKEGDLNYFVARSYVGHKIPYKNPEITKTEVIINQLSINWDSTVYLVEGMFDLIGLGIDNTIPLLGKYLHDKLFDIILKNAKANIIICLDPDAKRNAYLIYKQLNDTPQLQGRVRVIDLPLNLDIAKIKELYGHRGVLKCVRKARKLTFKDYIDNGL